MQGDLYLASYVQPSGLLVQLVWGKCRDDYYCERRIGDDGHVQAGRYNALDAALVRREVAAWEQFERGIGSMEAS